MDNNAQTFNTSSKGLFKSLILIMSISKVMLALALMGMKMKWVFFFLWILSLPLSLFINSHRSDMSEAPTAAALIRSFLHAGGGTWSISHSERFALRQQSQSESLHSGHTKCHLGLYPCLYVEKN